jgi:hypothetical protein
MAVLYASLTWQIDSPDRKKGSEAGTSVWQKPGLVAVPAESSISGIITISTLDAACEEEEKR